MDYFNIYKDIWNLHKKYAEPIDSDEYWNAVLAESKVIAAKYKSDFVDLLLLAVTTELERLCGKDNKYGKTIQRSI